MLPFFISDEMGFSDEELLLFAAASGKAVEDTATGNPLVFTTDLARPLKSLLIPFTPVQSGTGDPSPQNIRSILPWEGLKVWNGGQNIVTDDFTNGVLSLETGKATFNPQFVVSGFIPVKPLTSYYFRCPTVNKTELDIVYYDKDKQYIGYTDADGYSSCNTPGRSRKTPAGCYYVRIDARNAQYNNDICINYPASVTGYVPAVGITDTDIVFPSPVYGGYVDAVTGELWKTWQSYTFTGEEQMGIGSYSGTGGVRINSSVLDSLDPKYLTGISNKAAKEASVPSQITRLGFRVSSGSSLLAFFVPDSMFDGDATVDKFKSWLSENGLMICVELSEPVLITTLTPQQITALIGNNTIWSDAGGSMTAVYLKKG